MNKRYYYTDPIAAAYMAKHFGMSFDQFRLEHPDDLAHPGYEPNPKGVFIGWTGKRFFYIRPDSLHLLEPKEGDLCEKNSKPTSCHYCGMDRLFNANADTIELYGNDCTILKRNGVAFMWPELEEA